MKSFQQTQFALTGHLRNPDGTPAPEGLEDRRLGIYRDLIYNNIEGFIAGSFPVLRSLLSDTTWHALVRDFIVRHRAQTPYFLAISQEFLHYLMSERETQPDDFPFMLQLAHYEWAELAVDVADAELPPAGELPENWLLAKARVSPLVMNLAYQYPVHKISRDYIPQVASATYLLVYRDQEDDVKFMEVNALTNRLLYLLQENAELTLEQVVQQLTSELQHPEPEAFGAQAEQLVKQLFGARVISHFE